MWNSFDRKTKTCKNVVELIEQAKWLVGQFKPIIFNLKWLAGTQAEWLQECLQAQDFKHCKSLRQLEDMRVPSFLVSHLSCITSLN
jgi:hypothetical protein